jgi:hypothetical protein
LSALIVSAAGGCGRVDDHAVTLRIGGGRLRGNGGRVRLQARQRPPATRERRAQVGALTSPARSDPTDVARLASSRFAS